MRKSHFKRDGVPGPDEAANLADVEVVALLLVLEGDAIEERADVRRPEHLLHLEALQFVDLLHNVRQSLIRGVAANGGRFEGAELKGWSSKDKCECM